MTIVKVHKKEMNDMDYGQYEEVKAGEKAQTKVTEVNEGKQESFRTDKYFEM